MAVTIAAVIKNLCSSKRRKAEHVTYRNCIKTPASLARLVAPKPDKSPVCLVYPESD
jgi:hypothetical protein